MSRVPDTFPAEWLPVQDQEPHDVWLNEQIAKLEREASQIENPAFASSTRTRVALNWDVVIERGVRLFEVSGYLIVTAVCIEIAWK